MELELNDEQRLLVQTVRRFVKEQIVTLEDKLDPDADEIDREDHERLVAQVKDMGLYGLGIPAEYGGPAIDLVTHCLLEMEISQHRAGLYALCYGVYGDQPASGRFICTVLWRFRWFQPGAAL